ncbi:MAG: type I-E CRISPR-associated protein Cse2/CasB [Bifidobacteriaceae bacterium]|jgi:CRISPR system Cascade subunit CasB|nr:type I-E CRISPR-associated protein Cse2/CasB [Bifidobacteriaceae bacterium]
MSEAITGSPSVDRPGGHPRRHYWQRFAAHENSVGGPKVRIPEGGDLAALRRGAGCQPGSVPQLWPFYTELTDAADGISPRLRAEHHALVLFGFHQQSQKVPMNVAKTSLGAAVGTLAARERYSAAALERRFTAAATTEDVDGLAVLLRGLVTQLRHEKIGLDYDMLFDHLVRWQYPDARSRVRRRWGGDYYLTPAIAD